MRCCCSSCTFYIAERYSLLMKSLTRRTIRSFRLLSQLMWAYFTWSWWWHTKKLGVSCSQKQGIWLMTSKHLCIKAHRGIERQNFSLRINKHSHHQFSSLVISRHRWTSAGHRQPSVVVTSYRHPSVCIGSHRQSSVVIRSHRWSLENIGDHQQPSVVNSTHR